MNKEKRTYRYTGPIEHAYNTERGPWTEAGYISNDETEAVSVEEAASNIIYRWLNRNNVNIRFSGHYRLSNKLVEIPIVTQQEPGVNTDSTEDNDTTNNEQVNVPYQMAFEIFQDDDV